jgi:hypothetical protein
MAAFWNGNRLTGDNLREKPYVDLYSRVTTKSNVFNVHIRVQSLKKAGILLRTSGSLVKIGSFRVSRLLDHRALHRS